MADGWSVSRASGDGAATKRIVYLADQLGIDLPTREALVESFTSGYSLLDPTRPEMVPTNSVYRLQWTPSRA